MDARSQVILRQSALLQSKILLVGAAPDQLSAELQSAKKSISIWTWLANDAAYFKTQHDRVYFTAQPEASIYQDIEQAIVYIPKSKAQLSYLLQQLTQHLPASAQIWLVGAKKGGIEAAAKQLASYGKALKLDSARHCQLWQCTGLNQPTTHSTLFDFTKTYSLHIGSHQLELSTFAGSFSHGRIDRGTEILLSFLDDLPGQQFLDFGCGNGVLSLALTAMYPQAKIHAVDVDAFALAAAQLNSDKYPELAKRIHFSAQWDIDQVDSNFDCIISNPPFHQGIDTDYLASERLCLQAKDHLSSNGEIRLVANRFLNYPQLLATHFQQCQKLTDQDGFVVIRALTAKTR